MVAKVDVSMAQSMAFGCRLGFILKVCEERVPVMLRAFRQHSSRVEVILIGIDRSYRCQFTMIRHYCDDWLTNGVGRLHVVDVC